MGRVLTSHDIHPDLWSPRESGTNRLLTCVSFPDARRGWAAGHGGVIIHSSDGGKTWQVQRESSSEHQPLFDIQFVSPETGFACGAYDTFLKTRDGGKTWKLLPTGFDNIYNGLVFLDENTGYLAGEFGTVLRTEDGGKSWKQLDLGGYPGAFFDITLLSPLEILVFGISGKVMRSEDGGLTWKEIPLGGHDRALFRGAASGDQVVLAGASGFLFVSTDRGKSFQKIVDEDLTSFAGVRAHPSGGFLCLGERGKIKRVRADETTQTEESH
jgi:photosystem II stability/assembly factor-like uncharacterized protein